MKLYKSILALAFLFVGMSLTAQLDRSIMPEPAPEREIEIGEAKTFELKNGITVIVVNNDKLPRVTYSLIMDRKPLDEGDKAGMADMLGQMLTEGTSSRSKPELDEEVDFMGARLSASSGSAFASGLAKYDEQLMALLADVVRNPSFPQESFDKIAKQAKSGIESSKDDPNSISSNLIQTVLYGRDHPYGQIMTEETLENISLEDLKTLYSERFGPDNTYIAIVGDIKKGRAKKLVKKYFGDWEPIGLEETAPAFPATIQQNQVHIVDRPSSVQSVIDVTHVIDLKPETPDHMPMRVMNQILGGGSTGRLYKNLREDKGYTYGSYSSYGTSQYVSRFSATAEVRNNVTDSALTELLGEMNTITTELVTDEEMRTAKEALKGSFGRSLERPQTIANFALNTLRYDLPDDHYENYLIRLDQVSKEDIQRVAKKYIGQDGFHITIVGKSSEIASKLEPFGELTYHDFEGNVTDAPVQLPDGVTAQSIIDTYLQARGGKEKLMAVKSVSIEREGSIQGITITSTEVYSFPDKAYTKIQQGPMGQQEMIVNGDKVQMKQNGQAMPLAPEQADKLKSDMQWIEEMHYADSGVEVKAVGVGEVNGRQAYILEIRNGEEVSTSYFDVENGLKLRSQSNVEGPNGQSMSMNTDFIEYTETNGILFPQKVSVPVGPGMSLELTAKKIDVDGKVDQALFD